LTASSCAIKSAKLGVYKAAPTRIRLKWRNTLYTSPPQARACVTLPFQSRNEKMREEITRVSDAQYLGQLLVLDNGLVLHADLHS
jgi:hypothetical protein